MRVKPEYVLMFAHRHAATALELKRALDQASANPGAAQLDHCIDLVHTLQGTAGMVGLLAIRELGFLLECALETPRTAPARHEDETFAVLVRAATELAHIMNELLTGNVLTPSPELLADLRRLGPQAP